MPAAGTARASGCAERRKPAVPWAGIRRRSLSAPAARLFPPRSGALAGPQVGGGARLGRRRAARRIGRGLRRARIGGGRDVGGGLRRRRRRLGHTDQALEVVSRRLRVGDLADMPVNPVDTSDAPVMRSLRVMAPITGTQPETAAATSTAMPTVRMDFMEAPLGRRRGAGVYHARSPASETAPGRNSFG